MAWFYCWNEPEGEDGEVSTGSFRLQGGLQSAPGCMLIRKLDPLAAACKVCSQTPFRERLGDGCFCLLPLC